MSPPFILAKLLEKLRNRLAMLRNRRDQWTIGVDQAVQTPANVVAARIALAVLHVPHKSISPIAKPQSTIGTNLRIRRTKMLISRSNQIVG